MYFLPVTCVKFVPDSELVLAGSGNEVSLWDITRRVSLDRLILNQMKVIHGIEYGSERMVIVYGGFVLAICALENDRLKYLNTFWRHNDFILDCLVLSCDNEKSRFCLSLAHGTTCLYEAGFSKVAIGGMVEDCQFKLTKLLEVAPEQKSLLYCCHLFQSVRDKMENEGEREIRECKEETFSLFGGGVQGQISIWKISLNSHDHEKDKESERGDLRMIAMPTITEAHKGAVFGIHVHDNGNVMVSVGDDRYVVLWRRITSKPNDDQWRRERTMFGHDARVWSGTVLDNGHGQFFVVTWSEDCTVRLWNCIKSDNTVSKIDNDFECSDGRSINERDERERGGNKEGVKDMLQEREAEGEEKCDKNRYKIREDKEREGEGGRRRMVGSACVERVRPHWGRNIWCGDVRARRREKKEDLPGKNKGADDCDHNQRDRMSEQDLSWSVVTGGNDGGIVVTDFFLSPSSSMSSLSSLPTTVTRTSESRLTRFRISKDEDNDEKNKKVSDNEEKEENDEDEREKKRNFADQGTKENKRKDQKEKVKEINKQELEVRRNEEDSDGEGKTKKHEKEKERKEDVENKQSPKETTTKNWREKEKEEIATIREVTKIFERKAGKQKEKMKEKIDFPRKVFLLDFEFRPCRGWLREVEEKEKTIQGRKFAVVITDQGHLFSCRQNEEDTDENRKEETEGWEKPIRTSDENSLKKVTENDIEPKLIASYCSVFVVDSDGAGKKEEEEKNNDVDEEEGGEESQRTGGLEEVRTVLFGNIMGTIIVARVTLDKKSAANNVETEDKEQGKNGDPYRLRFETIRKLELGTKIMAIDRLGWGEKDEDELVSVALANGKMIALRMLRSSSSPLKREGRSSLITITTIDLVTLSRTWATCWTSWIDERDRNLVRLVCGDRDGFLHWFRLDRGKLFSNKSNVDSIDFSTVDTMVKRVMSKRNCCGITCLVFYRRMNKDKTSYQENNGGRLFVGTKSGEIFSLNVDDDNENQVEIVLKDADLLGWACRLETKLRPDCDASDTVVLIVTGFKSVFFRRYSLVIDSNDGSSQTPPPVLIAEHACGGGHRDWDFGDKDQRMVYIGQRSVHLATWASPTRANRSPQASQRPPSTVIIKPRLHGKEINFCELLHHSRSELVLMSGSEDCSLGLVSLVVNSSSVVTTSFSGSPSNSLPWTTAVANIEKVSGHISSVRCGTKVTGTDFVVTAGGRGQVMFWITTKENSRKTCDDESGLGANHIHGSNSSMSLRPVFSTLLPKLLLIQRKEEEEKQEQEREVKTSTIKEDEMGYNRKEIKETVTMTTTDPRVMDICSVASLTNIAGGGSIVMVALALSTGTVVVLSLSTPSVPNPFSPSLSSFPSSPWKWRVRVELELRLSSSCITNVAFVNNALFVACSTDGHIFFVPCSFSVPFSPRSPQSLSASRRLVARCALHGMDTITLQHGSPSPVLVSVGGDDGSISVLELAHPSERHLNLSWTAAHFVQFPLAHSGSVVATRWFHRSNFSSTTSVCLASLGSEGIIVLWRLSINSHSSSFVLESLNISISVAVTDPHSMIVFDLLGSNHDSSFDKSSPVWAAYVVGRGAQVVPLPVSSNVE